MEFVILGSAAAYAGPDEASSGCLVHGSKAKIVVDLGNGTLSELFKHIDPADLDAIIITHAHIDHFADLFSLKQYLRYNEKKVRITVYAPNELTHKLNALSEDALNTFKQVFEFVEIKRQGGGDEDEYVIADDLCVKFLPMQHIELDAFGVQVHPVGTDPENTGLLITGDTTAISGEFAGSLTGKIHTVLSEATLRDRDRPNAAHMSGTDAGEFASSIGAKRLILTHFWQAFDREERRAEATAVYAGEVLLARKGVKFLIP